MTHAEHLGQFRSLQPSFLVLGHSVDRTNLPNQPVDVMKKRIQGGKPKNPTRVTVSLSLFQETFLTSTFRNDNFLKNLRYDPTTYEAETFKTDDPRTKKITHQGFNGIQVLHHEKATLEAREVTKLLRRDTTLSNDEFPSYVRSIKLLFTR